MAGSISLASVTLLARQLSSNGERNRNTGQPLLSFCWAPSPFSSLPFSARNLSLSCSCSRPKSMIRRGPLFSEGREADENRTVCPGCGVFMQDSNPNLLGFYQKPSTDNNDDSGDPFTDSDEIFEEEEDGVSGSSKKLDLDLEIEGILNELSIEGMTKFDLGSDDDSFEEEEDGINGSSSKLDLPLDESSNEGKSKIDWDLDLDLDSDSEESSKEGMTKIDWDSDWDLEEDEEEKLKEELDGFTLAGLGYGNITEGTLKTLKREKVTKSEKKQRSREARKSEVADPATVCARCHSLRNYGQVKNEKAENLIPDFDFNRLISTRLVKPGSSAPVVVMVVDCVDFDGSFPRRAAKSLFKVLERSKTSTRTSKLPKLILVATKVDLLPSQISPTRLDKWVRNRAKSAGAPKLNGVYLVSSRKDLGVRNLLSFIKESAGPRGNVWVIGARNAGKSTLINALCKKEGTKIIRLTEAAVPGTTLGILRIAGILPAKAKMYDTPGLLHPYLMTMRLNWEEQKMVEIRKELQPRTYRIKSGQTIHVGGLVRLDLIKASVETIYVSIWASPNVSLHMGKTENADEIRMKHVGIRLQPPIGQDRASELGDWKRREMKVSGVSWDVKSVDIAASGLGWFSLGLKGEATVAVWTFDGLEVIEREPLVLDRAPFLERPGFWLPKAISDSISSQSRIEAEIKKKIEQERTESLLNASL